MEFFEAQTLDIQPPSQEERDKKPEGLLKKMLGKEPEEGPAREIQVGDGAWIGIPGRLDVYSGVHPSLGLECSHGAIPVPSRLQLRQAGPQGA